MIRQIRQCLEMIPRRLWWRWGFAMVVTVVGGTLESISAAALYALVTVIGEPQRTRTLPLVASAAAVFPQADAQHLVAGLAVVVVVVYFARSAFVALVAYKNSLLLGEANARLAHGS